MRLDLAAMTKRAKNTRKSTIALRAISPPATQATNLYRTAYRPIVQRWEGALSRIIAEYARTLAAMTFDSPADLRAEIDAAAEQPTVGIRAVLGRWAATVEGWHRRRWIANVLSATNVDLRTMIGPMDVRETVEAVIERNVALVSSINDEARRRIADAVFRGLTQRRSAEAIGREIREAVAMTRRRARNIAADQTVKIASALNEERRRQAGIQAWLWVHSDKRNPRPEHEARDGKLYSDDPNDAGTEYEGKTVRRNPSDKPGELPWCGCTSRAVLIL